MKKVNIEKSKLNEFTETIKACGKTRATMCNDVAYSIIKLYTDNGWRVPYEISEDDFMRGLFANAIDDWYNQMGLIAAGFVTETQLNNIINDSMYYIYTLANYYYDVWEEENIEDPED